MVLGFLQGWTRQLVPSNFTFILLYYPDTEQQRLILTFCLHMHKADFLIIRSELILLVKYMYQNISPGHVVQCRMISVVNFLVFF